MPNIELRAKWGVSGPGDLVLPVQEKTFAYLMACTASDVRISAYLDRDLNQVQAAYEEVFVSSSCPDRYRVVEVIPGSRRRKGITLPDSMEEGEQLTILVKREPSEAV